MSSNALGGLTPIEEATGVSRAIFFRFSSSIVPSVGTYYPTVPSLAFPLTVVKRLALGVVLQKIKETSCSF